MPHLMNIDSGIPGNSFVKAGDCYSFNIRLLGTAVNVAPYLIVATQNAALHGIKGVKSSLESIENESTGKIIWSMNNDSLVLPEINNLHIPEPNWKIEENRELKLNFVTPVAFRDAKTGKITKEPEFSRIIGSLMRHYSIFEPPKEEN